MNRAMLYCLASLALSLAACGTTGSAAGTAPDAADAAPDAAAADVAASDALADAAPDAAPADAAQDIAAPQDAAQDVAAPADVTAPQDAAAPDTADADAPDAIGPFVCCKSDLECGNGKLCYNGKGCVDKVISEDHCWFDADCAKGKVCQGAFVCPCNADCFAADHPGTCASLAGGCCNVQADCASGTTCPGAGKTCKSQSELQSGQCWADSDCPGGKCAGAGVCPCGAMCLVADKPGSCSSGICTILDPNSFGACEMILGVVFDGKACVYASGCSCGDKCASIYKDLASCQVACGMQ